MRVDWKFKNSSKEGATTKPAWQALSDVNLEREFVGTLWEEGKRTSFERACQGANASLTGAVATQNVNEVEPFNLRTQLR